LLQGTQISELMLKHLVHDAPVNIQVFMDQYVSGANHPRPPLGKFVVDVSLLPKDPGDIALCFDRSKPKFRYHVAPYIKQCFDGELQETLGASVAFRTDEELIQVVPTQSIKDT